METLFWMGFLGVAGFMALFWATHKLYRKFVDWRRKAGSAAGRDDAPGLLAPGAIDTPTPTGVNSRGQNIFVGVIAGVITNIVLQLLVDQLPGAGGTMVSNILRLVVLAVAVWAGVRVYRLLQRRGFKEEEESRGGSGSA